MDSHLCKSNIFLSLYTWYTWDVLETHSSHAVQIHIHKIAIHNAQDLELDIIHSSRHIDAVYGNVMRINISFHFRNNFLNYFPLVTRIKCLIL